MMHSFVWFTAIVLLTYYLLFHLSYKFRKNRLPLPPSPSKLPFIGNLHQLGPNLHRSLHKLSAKHGPLMLLQLGRVPTLIVSSPEMAEQILRTHDVVFADRPALKAARIIFYGGKSLIFAPYEEYWRQMRKVCTMHLLSSRMVQQFKHVRTEGVALLLERITRASASKDAQVAVPLTNLLYECSNDLMCKTVLGDVIKDDTKKKVLIELIRNISPLLGAFYAEDFFPGLWWVDVILGLEGRLKKYFRGWDALLQEILEEHEQMTGPMRNDMNFAQVLLSLKKEGMPLENDHIKCLLLEMIAAGNETTSTSLGWIIAELIRNPASLKKVQQELRENSHVTARGLVEEDDLSKMSYLKAVIKEAFRLHSPVPLLLPRESVQKHEIQGYVIPKQTQIFVNVWSIGRDPRIWEAPEEFRPERWLDSTVDFKGKDIIFLPFGAGRRICPGMQFAVASIELVMANLLYFFDWKLPFGMESCNMDMSEGPGLTAPRKQNLELVAIPRHLY